MYGKLFNNTKKRYTSNSFHSCSLGVPCDVTLFHSLFSRDVGINDYYCDNPVICTRSAICTVDFWFRPFDSSRADTCNCLFLVFARKNCIFPSLWCFWWSLLPNNYSIRSTDYWRTFWRNCEISPFDNFKLVIRSCKSLCMRVVSHLT